MMERTGVFPIGASSLELSKIFFQILHWRFELGTFKDILSNPAYGLSDAPEKLLLTSDMVKSFRAPYLAYNSNLYPSLRDEGFTSDSSEIASGKNWPIKKDGVWHFPLATITVGAQKTRTISMDYNIWRLQTNNIELLKRGTPEWEKAKKDVVDAYLQYFNTNYSTNRAPVIIGHHFDIWNDGVYWEAMKEFASEVCGQPDVRCSTQSELVDYLENGRQNSESVL
ncbi:hypothetical protein KW782_03220 [Candidatus Parcubacteria bacterium]|nr:hypothetical protein [Candidatus Parcubacteria bacterium]